MKFTFSLFAAAAAATSVRFVHRHGEQKLIPFAPRPWPHSFARPLSPTNQPDAATEFIRQQIG